MLSTVERLIGAGLATDPEFLEALASHSGKRLHVVPEGTGGRLEITIQSYGVKLDWLSDTQVDDAGAAVVFAAPDVEVRGTPLALLALLQAARDEPAAGLQGVSVSGDMHTLEEFRHLASKLKIDWEELLAGRIGDTAAHQLLRGLTGAAAHLSQALSGRAALKRPSSASQRSVATRSAYQRPD